MAAYNAHELRAGKIGAAFKIFTSSEIYFQKIFAQFAHFQVKV